MCVHVESCMCAFVMCVHVKPCIVHSCIAYMWRHACVHLCVYMWHHACVCSCMHVNMWRHACVCVYMWRPKDNFKFHLQEYALPPIISFSLVWRSLSRLAWLVNPRESSCLDLFWARITSMHHHAQNFYISFGTSTSSYEKKAFYWPEVRTLSEIRSLEGQGRTYFKRTEGEHFGCANPPYQLCDVSSHHRLQEWDHLIMDLSPNTSFLLTS